MILMYFYHIEELREELLRQIRTHGSIQGACLALNISLQAYYKCKARLMDLPRTVQERLGVSKVMDQNTVIGYVGKSEIDWKNLWK